MGDPTGSREHPGTFCVQFRPNTKKSSEILTISELFLWQRVKDSNPHIQSQSLLCYLYTNPLCLSAAANRYYYSDILVFVNRVFKRNAKFPENLSGRDQSSPPCPSRS